ncbi:MAG: hypothetical protein QG588_1507 [Candidatus Poribacteria bacterium]|nr:hypothetical protein [Candidatus Poribacteria bacterium]
MITDEEAISICRTTKPTVGAIKKVIQWANDDPSPDKITLLMLLQTGNYASRKGLDELSHDAISRCAKENQSSLWETVNEDWEIYRVLHALRALASLDGKANIEKMIELGRTKILRTHWAVIQEAAKNSGILIPPDIIEEQKRLEALRGNSDFYDYFNARKPNWNAKHEQAVDNVVKNPAQHSKKPTPVFPEVFSPVSEQNKFLRTYKSSIQRRLTFTRMEGLFEEVDLAFYLTALKRTDEALQSITFLVSNVEFNGNYNIWTPVGFGICLQERLYRLAGKNQFAETALKRIQVHPFQAESTKTHVEKDIAELQSELEDGYHEKSIRTACRKLSRTLYLICYYRETGVAGFPHSGWYSVEELERLFSDGLNKLCERLESN